MTTAMTATSPVELPQWTFADRMRKIRRDVLGVEQAELAEKLGVTRQAYAAWEAGRNEPRSILAIAKKVELMSGVPAAWVLGIDSLSVDTGARIRRYVPGNGSSPRHLALVTGLSPRYPAVPAANGSSPAAVANADDRPVSDSSGAVNDAHAA